MPVYTTTSTNTTRYFIFATSHTTASTNTYYGTDNRAVQRRQLEAHPKEAKDRADQLLLEHLTEEQQVTFRDNNWFVVKGGKTGKRYRIESAHALVANIAVLSGDAVAHRLCGHCDVKEVPLGDHLLAQKLMLEHAEEEFLQLANRHAA